MREFIKRRPCSTIVTNTGCHGYHCSLPQSILHGLQGLEITSCTACSPQGKGLIHTPHSNSFFKIHSDTREIVKVKTIDVLLFTSPSVKQSIHCKVQTFFSLKRKKMSYIWTQGILLNLKNRFYLKFILNCQLFWDYETKKINFCYLGLLKLYRLQILFFKSLYTFTVINR